MNGLSILLALLPVLVVLILLVRFRMAADLAGIIGLAVAVLAAWLYFQTPLSVLAKAGLSGVVASFPITLMVMTSLLQVFIMIASGALSRIVVLIKTVAPHDQVIQIMIVNVGFGTLLAAMGATPVSILPPIMLALGYSSFVAIALPALGYDALCTYALLGVPVVVFAGLVNLPVNEVGGYFARFMPVISTCIAIGMLWMVGKWRMVWKGLIPALLSGPDGRADRHRHESHPAGPAHGRRRGPRRDAGDACLPAGSAQALARPRRPHRCRSCRRARHVAVGGALPVAHPDRLRRPGEPPSLPFYALTFQTSRCRWRSSPGRRRRSACSGRRISGSW